MKAASASSLTSTKVVSFFTDLGIPAPTLNAYFNASLETVGGILLVLGLASRLIAVPLLINMIVAYITADREAFTCLFFRVGKILRRGPIPVPAGVAAGLDFRTGMALPGHAGCVLVEKAPASGIRCYPLRQMLV